MRVNIKNNEITSVEFLNIDEVIEFIQKFNKDRNKESDSIDFDKIADKIIDRNRIDTGPFTNVPNSPVPVWYQNLSDPYTQRINTPHAPDPNQFKVEDPIPYPYTITSATK